MSCKRHTCQRGSGSLPSLDVEVGRVGADADVGEEDVGGQSVEREGEDAVFCGASDAEGNADQRGEKEFHLTKASLGGGRLEGSARSVVCMMTSVGLVI